MFSIKGLSGSDLEAVRKHLVSKEISKNSVLYEYGAEASAMYFVESGAFKLVERKAQDGRDDLVMSVVKPGGFFGEEALLNEDSRYQHTAVAIETTLVYELSRSSMQKLMTSSMSTGTKILLGISRNYREAVIVPEQQGRLIVFYAPKDGVGKTTLAVNTAVKLAMAKKKVAFIDCDLQFGDSPVYLGLAPLPNIGRLVQLEEHLLYNRIKLYLHQKWGMDILLSPDLPQESEIITRSNLNHIIMEVSKNYDYVVIDCPSHLDEHSLLLWDSAERLVFVSSPELAGLTRLHRLMKVLARLDYPKEKFLSLVNRLRPDQADFVKEFEKLVPENTYKISENIPLAQSAQLSGTPWTIQEPESNLARDLNPLIDSLLGKTKQKMERGGIFSRLKSIFAG